MTNVYDDDITAHLQPYLSYSNLTRMLFQLHRVCTSVFTPEITLSIVTSLNIKYACGWSLLKSL